jgi:lipopolysaccharide assembly protein A
MMYFLIWVIRLSIFAIFLLLAVANTQQATLNFVGYQWQTSLIVIGFAFFATGLLTGLLFTLPASLRRQLEIRRLKREIKRFGEATVLDEELPPLV